MKKCWEFNTERVEPFDSKESLCDHQKSIIKMVIESLDKCGLLKDFLLIALDIKDDETKNIGTECDKSLKEWDKLRELVLYATFIDLLTGKEIK